MNSFTSDLFDFGMEIRSSTLASSAIAILGVSRHRTMGHRRAPSRTLTSPPSFANALNSSRHVVGMAKLFSSSISEGPWSLPRAAVAP